jgi:hypothetical protein
MLPYQLLAQIMGGPTTLTSSESIAQALSEAFDFSSSKSKAKGTSAGIGFGG